MTNSERLLIEIKDIDLSPDEVTVYLMENDLTANNEYDPESATNKRNIYKTALSILESIANQPSQMKNYKKDDISVSQFAENIQNRIEQLERKIRQMRIDDTKPESNTFILFG
jgi:hypothetical protein